MPTVSEQPKFKKLPKGTIRPLAGTKTKPKGRNAPRIWLAEHVKPLIEAQPRLLTEKDGHTRLHLLMEAQKLLPENLRRRYESLWSTVLGKDDGFEKLMLLKPKDKKAPKGNEAPPAAKAWSEAVDAALPMPDAQPTARGNREGHSLVKWKTREHLPVIAHAPEVKPLIEAEYVADNMRLVDAVMEAQHKHLPREKWRPRSSLRQSCYGKPGLVNQLRAALKQPNPHPPEQPETLDIELDLASEPQVAEPPAIVALPPHIEQIGAALGALGNAFKPLVATMLAGLLPLLEQAVTNGVTRGLASMPRAEGLDPEAIKAGVRETVIDILGAPPPPAAEPIKPAPKAEPIVLAPHKPRVDVVGLLGDQENVVRSKCGGQFDLRFIGAKEVERHKVTAPVAIMCRKFVSHSAQDRIRKAGANLVYANGGADSVVAQLQQMLQ